ncbi:MULTISPECIES: porin [unclassified Mesorhizobium]|uniref:porin n=1 Tax=unclassified Mesorhizobium TaxID=325217 RepID=UPI000FCB59E6|nr:MULTISPECIES: porin [unclassified Mesorhizobium]RUU82589.1 porin [Mesorhizobium sp. M7A.T.Ca.TU.009.01.1.2]MCQ8871063.1 porin [Mesorhizobium sp. LMG17149]RUT87173.1 porin [Mesorhizobium sp. M7A.T.Ca.US.000.02.1.1]RUT90840.1 porin [Mesorhizobium sp. M7A.T.Ca.US.000.02.2.1]RUT99276.1 porin [Mesorhizobium sp. M7A.T.Ca.TU.009.02.1.1]
MNIKSLLLGSAAALIAVSGARAADAVVVAEPEPAEYVKICDVYGAGYFYIPGTETCLRIGGYLRYDMGVGDSGALDGANNVADHMDGDRNDTYYKNMRFTLRTYTGQETELGTLKTFTETRFQFGNSSGDYTGDGTGWQAGNKATTLNFAWIQLGGLRVGKDETVYDQFIGYAGNVIQDTLIPYGVKDTNLISYYFDAGSGFTGVVSLEEGTGVNTIDSYVPHVVGGLKYKGDWGAITGVVAYDSNYEEVSGKVRLDVNVSKELTLFVMGGYGTNDNINDFGTGRTQYKPWGGNWAIWGGGTYKFNDKTSFNAQVSYDDWKNLGVAANVAYTIVPGFTITTEVDYLNAGKFDDLDFNNWTKADKKSSVGGIVRFQRNF